MEKSNLPSSENTSSSSNIYDNSLQDNKNNTNISSTTTGSVSLPEENDLSSSSSSSSSNPSSSLLSMTRSTTNTRKENIIVKIGMVGDSGIGKTSLMVRYVQKTFDEQYTETLGVNFMEERIVLPDVEVTMSIWDLGGDRTYVSMLPMIVLDAVAILFLFDLTSLPSLNSVKEWYRQVRSLNKTCLPFLVGTKFDLYYQLPKDVQESTLVQARKYAKAMKAPLIFCSSALGINVLKLFKLIFEKVFGLDIDIEKYSNLGEPILEY